MIIISLFLSLILLWSAVSAITIQVSGVLNLVLGEAALDGPPGSNLRPEYESSRDKIRITVFEQYYLRWQVNVRKTDNNWHPDLHLFIRRTSDGNGDPTSRVIGGLDYREISDFDRGWFRGGGNRDNINAQLKLTGVSVSLPVDTYTTIIMYTVIEL